MDTHIVAKTLVFNAQHQVLLLRRSDDDVYRPGQFDLPGGQVDPGEDVVAGGIREALEEAGLVLDPAVTRIVHAGMGGRKDHHSDRRISIVRVILVSRVEDSTVTLSHEHQAYEWCSLDEAIARTDHPVHQEVMRYLRDNHIAAEYWS
jgi:8-oxo-dGTP pyrophosphatase MutT (NUDIX family)